MVFEYLKVAKENNEYMNKDAVIMPGKATSRMSAQSIEKLLMVILSYFFCNKF